MACGSCNNEFPTSHDPITADPFPVFVHVAVILHKEKQNQT